MVRLDGVESQRCTHAPLVALQALEAALLFTVLWRTAHHVWCKSHPRRVCFHLVRMCFYDSQPALGPHTSHV